MRIRLRLRLQRQQPRRRRGRVRGRVRLPNVLHLLPRAAGDALHVARGVRGWHPVSARVPAMRTRKRRRPAEARQVYDAPAERRVRRSRDRGRGSPAKRRSKTLAPGPRAFFRLPAGCCCHDRRPRAQVPRWLSAQTERHKVRVEIP